MSEQPTVAKRTLGTAAVDPERDPEPPVEGDAGDRERLSAESQKTYRERARRFRRTQPRAWLMKDAELREHFDRMDNDDDYHNRHVAKEMGHEFMATVRSSDATEPETTSKKSVSDVMNGLSQMQRTTMMMMLGQMMRYNPMNAGARNPMALAQGLTTGAMFMALSPDFREIVGAGRRQLISAITGRVDDRVDRNNLRMESRDRQRIDRYERGLAGDFSGSDMHGMRLRFQALRGDPDKEDRLIASWSKRLEALYTKEREGRGFLLDNTTAAWTKLGVCENAYEKMCERGPDGELLHDQDAVMARYQEVIAALDKQCVDDGLSVASVDRTMRVLVGERLAEEFDFQDRVHGPSHGQVRPDEEKPVRGLDGKMRYAWTGDFIDTGGQDPKESWFAPRAPQSAAEHVARLSHSMFYETVSTNDLAGKKRALEAFARASSMHNDEAFSQLVKSDREDLTSPEFTLTKQAVAFQRCMKRDGFTDGEIYRAYGKALEDAAEATFEQSPKLRTMMEATEGFGPKWYVTGSEDNRSLRAHLRGEVHDSVPHRVGLTEEAVPAAPVAEEAYADRPDATQLRQESVEATRAERAERRAATPKRGVGRVWQAMRADQSDKRDQEGSQSAASAPQKAKRAGDAGERARAASEKLAENEQSIREKQDARLRAGGWDPAQVRSRMDAQKRAAEKERSRRTGERIRRIDREQRIREQDFDPSL